MKVDIEDVLLALSEHGVDETVRKKIVADLEEATQAEKVDRAPKKKSSYFLVKPTNVPGKEGSMFLLKAAEDYNFTALTDSFRKVRLAYNETKKGRKTPAKNVVDVIELAKPKQFKEEKLQVLLREPIVIIDLENIL